MFQSIAKIFMRYYVVTDIHGFYSEMEASLRESGYFLDKEEHKLIICGDLLDRGGETLKIQSFVLDLLAKNEIILIRGNHEDLLLDLVDRANEWLNVDLDGNPHYKNGTLQSALDLIGLSIPEAILHPSDFASRVKETPFYKTIIPAMKDYFETEHYIFVHGWIPCTVLGNATDTDSTFLYDPDWRDASKERWAKARWINGMAAASRGAIEENKTIVCGHWHCSYGHSKLEGKGEEISPEADFSPYYARGIISLDGCTAYSGKVNCIVIED